jgi:predicted dehydrogenase
VCLCSREPENHLREVDAAVRFGCHVYCEKPFAATLDEADKMIAAAESAKLKSAVAHLARYAETFNAAKAMIAKGEIGRLVTMYGRGKEDERGGGEDMIVLGTHIIDLFRFFAGDPKWVFGEISVEGRPCAPSDVRTPTEPVGPVAGDELIALYGFENSVRGFSKAAKGFPPAAPTRLDPGGDRGDASRPLLRRQTPAHLPREGAAGEGGEFVEVETAPAPDPEGSTLLTPGGDNGYFSRCNRTGALDLMDAIEKNREPASSARDARWALEMIQGVYASHFAGRKLAFPLASKKHPLLKSE